MQGSPGNPFLSIIRQEAVEERIVKPKTLRYMAVRWSRPPLRRFKFNVDGASRGNGL